MDARTRAEDWSKRESAPDTLSVVMATVATEKKRAPRAAPATKTAGRSQNAPIARSTRARGGPSAHALEAHRAFAELQPFFDTKTALAKALGWSLPTLRGWFDSVPTRPREGSARDVIQLRDLAVAAGKWVSDPLQVGEWLLSPLPELRGSVPSRLAVELPPEGVELLISDIALIAPRQRATLRSTKMSVDQLRETLAKLKVRSLPPVAAVGEVDLSDFD
ncbi:MAG: hypothetical protein ACYDHH_17945 [Solirubrobacteraceae bacterium]